MRKKRIMVVGPFGCGKTSLAHCINKDDSPVRRTQDIIYGKYTIDVPSAFIENTWMYKHLIALSQDASRLLLMVDQSRCTEVYSPGFAKAFSCPVTGVIGKCDLSPEREVKCREQLVYMGVTSPYFKISIPDGTGLDLLNDYLLTDIER